MRSLPAAFFVLVATSITGCATRFENAPERAKRAAQLATELKALSPSVDPHEADIFGKVAVERCAELRKRYNIRNHRWIHNVAIYWGVTERGNCWQWATDLKEELDRYPWRTLHIERIESHVGRTFHEHHSLAVTAIDRPDHRWVLDAWRHEGILWFGEMKTDIYPWVVSEVQD
jgi:hypothetical protein